MADNVFTSPFAEYEGTITAPAPFLGKHYREWNKALSTAQSKKLGFWLEQWQGLASVCDVAFDAFPADKTGEEIPYSVLCWAVGAFTSYIRPLTDPK